MNQDSQNVILLHRGLQNRFNSDRPDSLRSQKFLVRRREGVEKFRERYFWPRRFPYRASRKNWRERAANRNVGLNCEECISYAIARVKDMLTAGFVHCDPIRLRFPSLRLYVFLYVLDGARRRLEFFLKWFKQAQWMYAH